MFQINSHFPEHFRRLAFEIISESSPFLNKNADCSSNTLSANQVFQKMLQFFLEHLIYLSTEASLGNNSSKDLICYLMYHHLSCRDDFTWKKIISNTSKKYIKNRSSLNFIHMYLLFQKFLVPVICFAIP